MIKFISDHILMFFIFSMIGWAGETTYRSLGERKLINTGFLYGPMCPIYGTGALVFEVFLTPLQNHIWLVILLGMILADGVEYFTSYIMEKLFNARWWDYTDEFMNLHGRICLKHTSYWAIASFVYVYFVSPIYSYLISFVVQPARYAALCVILIVFLIDLVFTVRAALGIQKIMRSIDALKASITLAVDSVRTTAENLRDDAEFRYDDLVAAIAGSSEKFSIWKNDMAGQFSDIKQKLDDMGNRKSVSSTQRRASRLYISSVSMRQAAEKRIKDLENKIDELKAKLEW
mgnify:CR=1 FL=1